MEEERWGVRQCTFSKGDKGHHLRTAADIEDSSVVPYLNLQVKAISFTLGNNSYLWVSGCYLEHLQLEDLKSHQALGLKKQEFHSLPKEEWSIGQALGHTKRWPLWY